MLLKMTPSAIIANQTPWPFHGLRVKSCPWHYCPSSLGSHDEQWQQTGDNSEIHGAQYDSWLKMSGWLHVAAERLIANSIMIPRRVQRIRNYFWYTRNRVFILFIFIPNLFYLFPLYFVNRNSFSCYFIRFVYSPLFYPIYFGDVSIDNWYFTTDLWYEICYLINIGAFRLKRFLIELN